MSKSKIQNNIPQHIAIIMDGNGRWAKRQGLDRIEGHRRGVQVTEDIVEACSEMGVKYLTLYAFSDENWQRPSDEVAQLMQLLSAFLRAKCEKMVKNNIKFDTIGEVGRLPEDVRKEISEVKEKTAGLNGMRLILALSYGSHNEMARAFGKLVKEGKKEVTPEDIGAHLDTAGIPDPDLVIRTSGEYRLSNFMLWQSAYAEFYFTDILWPEFDRAELEKAIADYSRRERRFGGIGEVV